MVEIPETREEWLKLCEALAESILKAQKRPVEYRIGDVTFVLTQFVGVVAESLGYQAQGEYNDKTKNLDDNL